MKKLKEDCMNIVNNCFNDLNNVGSEEFFNNIISVISIEIDSLSSVIRKSIRNSNDIIQAIAIQDKEKLKLAIEHAIEEGIKEIETIRIEIEQKEITNKSICETNYDNWYKLGEELTQESFVYGDDKGETMYQWNLFIINYHDIDNIEKTIELLRKIKDGENFEDIISERARVLGSNKILESERDTNEFYSQLDLEKLEDRRKWRAYLREQDEKDIDGDSKEAFAQLFYDLSATIKFAGVEFFDAFDNYCKKFNNNYSELVQISKLDRYKKIAETIKQQKGQKISMESVVSNAVVNEDVLTEVDKIGDYTKEDEKRKEETIDDN